MGIAMRFDDDRVWFIRAVNLSLLHDAVVHDRLLLTY